MDIQTELSQTVQTFLDQMGFDKNITFEVSYDKEDNRYQVLLKSDTPALLIGYHGNTLSGLQLF